MVSPSWFRIEKTYLDHALATFFVSIPLYLSIINPVRFVRIPKGGSWHKE
jgi:hypothetical protein